MRIVYVLTTLAVGGTERQVLGIAKRMAARGHAVAIVVLRRRERDWLTSEMSVLPLDVSKGAAGAIAGLRRGLKFLRAFRPDVIHCHNFHGNLLARSMKLFYRDARLISTIHNVYEGGRWRMIAYRISDGLVDRTTAVSTAVAERFVRLKAVRREKCIVIPNGIEASAFVPNGERRMTMRSAIGVTNEFVWLTVGRNTAAKDRPNLLQAFRNVWRTEPRVRLLIAGDRTAEGDSAYRSTGMPEGAMDRVQRLGMRNDIAALLDAADGFVLASAWEGMPLAMGEAMAMAKPVVGTDVGGVRELVGDAGALAPAKNADALAAAMLEIMQRTPEERAAMGRAARERILAKFDMDGKADEWEALYRSVIR